MQETKVLHKKKVLAPKLRFKEFSDAWNDKKLGDVLEITSASRVHKDEWTENGVPFFRSSDVVAAFKGNENTKAYISFELYTSLANKSGRVKKDDILITGGGSIGIPFLIKNNEPLYFKDADLLWIKNTNEISGYFLYSFFLTQSFKNYINTTSHVGTIAHYTVIQAKNTPFQFPSLPEQQKIAGFLSAVDEKIQLLNRKKQLLEQYKIGVMQQLFAGHLRFKDENGKAYPKWEEKRLGEYLIYKSERNEDKKVDLVLSVSNKKGFITQDEQFDGYNVASKDISNYKIVHKNDIAYNPSRINVGSIARLNNFEKGIVSPMYVVFALKKELDSVFFENQYSTHRFKHLIKVGCSGSVRDSLNFEDLANFKFNFPSLQEQKKIADFLSAIDVKIESLSNQIIQTQNFKKGLLQQMFV
jgi:type I restriction enzyme S subunit